MKSCTSNEQKEASRMEIALNKLNNRTREIGALLNEINCILRTPIQPKDPAPDKPVPLKVSYEIEDIVERLESYIDCLVNLRDDLSAELGDKKII